MSYPSFIDQCLVIQAQFRPTFHRTFHKHAGRQPFLSSHIPSDCMLGCRHVPASLQHIGRQILDRLWCARHARCAPHSNADNIRSARYGTYAAHSIHSRNANRRTTSFSLPRPKTTPACGKHDLSRARSTASGTLHFFVWKRVFCHFSRTKFLGNGRRLFRRASFPIRNDALRKIWNHGYCPRHLSSSFRKIQYRAIQAYARCITGFARKVYCFVLLTTRKNASTPRAFLRV